MEPIEGGTEKSLWTWEGAQRLGWVVIDPYEVGGGCRVQERASPFVEAPSRCWRAWSLSTSRTSNS